VTRSNRRTLRTLAQLVASSGFTGLVAALTSGLSPWWVAVVLASSQLGITKAQNWLEENDFVPELLAAPTGGRS
jgi:hypothetical protein